MTKKRNKSKRDKDGYEYHFDDANIKGLPRMTRPSWMPSPRDVASMLRNEKITIFLEHETVEFFRKQAKKYHVSYQQMIREVLRNYTAVQQSQRRAA